VVALVLVAAVLVRQPAAAARVVLVRLALRARLIPAVVVAGVGAVEHHGRVLMAAQAS
jgi:hypothetical protein